MPHDMLGNELRVGDRVMIPARVEQLYEQPDACNVTVRVDESAEAPKEYRPVITMNARLLAKLEPMTAP